MKYPQLVSMPSAVSDWLEEQLEARGIDAVVYTRYVLSLLYRDPIDIICPDHSHEPSFYKELKRTGGGGGRRKGGSYWGHADADQLKRSAAVECLKSASDQKWGIESLVDELCEKLKGIEEGPTPPTSAAVAKVTTKRASKEEDSAKRYYAAFPALTRNPATSPKLIHLVPKRHCYVGRKQKSAARSYDERLHATCKLEKMTEMKARSLGKQRFNYFARNKTNAGESDGRKFVTFFNNNNNNNKTSPTKQKKYSDRERRAEVVMAAGDEEEDETMGMYDDLPVDIRDLLDSPTTPLSAMRRHVDLMNMANMRDAGSNKFIQCGTNIISSIWSTQKDANAESVDETCTWTACDAAADDSYLDLKFSSLWPSEAGDDGGDGSGMWHYTPTRWSDGNDAEHYLARSLSKLNHNRERSCFVEVQQHHRTSYTGCKANVVRKPNAPSADDKEDLLYSKHSHFRPINEKAEASTTGKQYPDGTTFAIVSDVDRMRYENSTEGEIFLELAGIRRRYFAYKCSDKLKLHFVAAQNDKACQTDDESGDDASLMLHVDDVLTIDEERYVADASPLSSLDGGGARSDSVMAELFGKEAKCDKCNSNEGRNDDLAAWGVRRADITMTGDCSSIWTGEICMACLRAKDDGKLTPMDEHSRQLRDDIKEDGEQLLSDLSSLQRSYMAEGNEDEEDDDIDTDEDDLDTTDLPMAEESCDLNALIDTEWQSKPAAAGVPVHSASFSFATRLQQDCLLKMATIPMLRSVTL